MLATDKQKAYIIQLMRRKCFWEKLPKDITDEQLVLEVERRWSVSFLMLSKPDASKIIGALKEYLTPTKRSRGKRYFVGGF